MSEDPGVDASELVARHQGTDEPDGEHRPVDRDVAGQQVEPSEDHSLAASAKQLWHRQLDPVGRQGGVPCGEGVPDR